jgi:hypothetical protein
MKYPRRNCVVCGRFLYKRGKPFCSHRCYRFVWALENSELDKSYKDRWNATHKAEHTASTLAWRARNKAHWLAVDKAWRKKNIDKRRAQDRARYRKALGHPLHPTKGRPRLPVET